VSIQNGDDLGRSAVGGGGELEIRRPKRLIIKVLGE
jgi:hypothetical protein